MLQDEFHILISIVEKVSTNCCANDKMNKIRCDVHLMDTPEEPWKKNRLTVVLVEVDLLTEWNS